MHVWRERLGRWFDGPARRCPLSPNTITVLALLVNLAAAVALSRQMFLWGMALLILGGFADAFDGIVARVQGKSSPFGDFLDHVADRVSDAALAAGWLIGSGVAPLLTLAGTVVVMLNGYVGTQIEATFRERNYESIGRGEFVLALVVYPIVSHILLTNGWLNAVAGPLRIVDWMALLMIAAGLFGIMQRFSLALRLGRPH
ncbi:MAG TPA: CDP-alcohol phosphatidyltransferase family protein [Thermoanaerobaculia bacterium]|nr:CDP-alcohol phosphatidyltransferase family protein [Thermoanaerobaculia bacterium]